MLKAIETSYAGYRFRSRLEARWSVFLDALGLKWEYEPEGFDLDGLWYLPDFWLPEQQCWIEVKPKSNTWYRWNPDQKEYGWVSKRGESTPSRTDVDFIDTATKARRLTEASGFPVFILFSELCPLQQIAVSPATSEDPGEYRLVGSNKAWWPDGKHDDGCVTWGQCPHCLKASPAGHGQHDLCSCQCVERKTWFAPRMFYGGPRLQEYCSVCGTNVTSGEGFPHRWIPDDTKGLIHAYTAARSARFEHGESPTRTTRRNRE